MREVWFAIPGDLETLTGGYIYAKKLVKHLPEFGWTPKVLRLPNAFPYPSDADLDETHKIFSALPKGAVLMVDGLVLGATPEKILDKVQARIVALVHHPLALESGLSESDTDYFYETEKGALRFTAQIITTGPDTARTLASRYEAPLEKLFVARPGTNPAQRAPRFNIPPTLLCVATLTYRKGHDILVEALSKVAELSWNCTCVGSLERDPNVVTQIRNAISVHTLDYRVRLCGELSGYDLEHLYMQSDIFVLPSRHEGYGMAFTEALAHGLPIVACAAGAVPETVPADAGLLVPPEDPAAFAQALRTLITDIQKYSVLSDASWRHGQTLPRWSDTAHSVAKALDAAAA